MVERLSGRLAGIGAEELVWEPAPGIPSAWRLRHMATDCFGSYAAGIFDPGDPMVSDDPWRDLQREWAAYRAGVVGDPDPSRLLGPAFGPFADSSRASLHLHALDEVAHHGGEVGLLRDLWAARGAH